MQAQAGPSGFVRTAGREVARQTPQGRTARGDHGLPQSGSVPVVAGVGLRLGQDAHEAVLHVGSAGGAQQIESPPGGGQGVEGLQARNVVEKPGAAGEAGQCQTLHEQQAAGVGFFRAVQLLPAVAVQKEFQIFCSGQSQAVFPQGQIRIGEKLRAAPEKMFIRVILQIIEAAAQGPPPVLGPVRMSAVGASAVCFPPFQTVGAAPGRVLVQDCLVVGRVRRQIRGVIGQGQIVAPLPGLVHHIGQGHFSEGKMVTVGFAVRGDVPQTAGKGRRQFVPEVLPVFQQPLEGHGLGCGAVVEKHGYGLALGQADQIGPRGVEGIGGNGAESGFPGAAYGGRLPGSQDGEGYSGVGQRLQGGQIHGGFSQPHAFGIAAEALPEILNGPQHFQGFVQFRGQRHDGMMIDLGQSVAVSPAVQALGVRRQNAGIGFGRVPLHPGQERRPEIEAHPGVAVDHLPDQALTVQSACHAEGRVALPGDARIPVVVRRGPAFGQDILDPGIEARGLVKVAVDAQKSAHGWLRVRNFRGMPPRASPDGDGKLLTTGWAARQSAI